MHQTRLKKLRALLNELDIPALYITSDVNRAYLTGFTGSAGSVLVTESLAILFIDFRYRQQAPLQAPDYTIVELPQQAAAAVAETLNANKVKRLGFEQNHVTYGLFKQLTERFSAIELVATDGLVERLRMIKDENELRIMREAAELADRTFEHMLGFLKPGITEQDAALELEFFMRSNGASATSFDTIIASGERSALPHGVASERVIGNNEFVKLDFGAYYQGYCSDITRTVVLGEPTAKHREIYDIVLEAQLFALDHIRPGMTGKEADALTRDIITRYGYGEQFGHGTGHGLGMEIHEAPRLSIGGDTILLPGMTVTVEPGIYLPDFGGVRIEDDIVITETGISLLTHASKSFQVIK